MGVSTNPQKLHKSQIQTSSHKLCAPVEWAETIKRNLEALWPGSLVLHSEKRKVSLFETSWRAKAYTWGCPNGHKSAIYYKNVPTATQECMHTCTHRENPNRYLRSDTAFKDYQGCLPKSYSSSTKFQNEMQCTYKQANWKASRRRQG